MRAPTRMHAWLSAVAFAMLAASLLTIVPAPIYGLAILAIAVTEWGHVGVVAALLIAALLLRSTSARGRAAAAAAVVSAAILSAPTVRAVRVAQGLPATLKERFGASRERGRPLSVAGLFTPAGSSAARSEAIVFASRQNQTLAMDVFRDPAAAGPRPVIIVVHGGSWQAGTRDEFEATNAYLASRGWLVASIDYRLAPRWKFPAALDDVKAAMDYMHAHARELGADAARMVLMGRSAGAQLALLAAYTSGDPSVRGVVAFYGPSDMRYAFDHPNNPLILDSRATLTAYLGGSPAELPSMYDAASPILHVTASTPPTLLIHGGRDQLVKEAQSILLDARLAREGRPHFFLRLGWATHACDYNQTGPCGQLSRYAVDYFLESVLR